VHFDASASEAVDGTIVRHDWTFGDGTVLVDGGAAPTHTYAGPGDYTATVTLTDSSGCSVAETFTGLMSICAGSSDAATSMVVHVTADAPPPVPPASPPAPPTPSAAPLTPEAAPAEPPLQPAAPETLVVPRSLTGTPTVRGARVRLAWTPAPGAPRSKRYLVSWSPLHSSQGPADPLMRRAWTTSTSMLMPGARPGTTLHYAVYAYGSDGVLVKAGKTTIRLPGAGG
jgi:hypothetical protein